MMMVRDASKAPSIPAVTALEWVESLIGAGDLASSRSSRAVSSLETARNGNVAGVLSAPIQISLSLRGGAKQTVEIPAGATYAIYRRPEKVVGTYSVATIFTCDFQVALRGPMCIAHIKVF